MGQPFFIVNVGVVFTPEFPRRKTTGLSHVVLEIFRYVSVFVFVKNFTFTVAVFTPSMILVAIIRFCFVYNKVIRFHFKSPLC